MDKDLESILKKANKLSQPENKKKAPERVFKKSEPYDYLVFTKLTAFSGFRKLIFFLIIPGGICTGFLAAEFRDETIITLLIYASLLAVYGMVNLLRYQFVFKGWKEKLPYQLNGWDEMIRAKKMFCDLCWTNIKITIEPQSGDLEISQLIDAALRLFCKRTEMAFYTMRMGTSSKRSREDWKITSPNVCTGSASPEVMRYMKDLFEKELATIARKTSKIKAVNIELLSEEFEVLNEIENGD